MSGAYTGPGTDEASQYIRTIHAALAERVSRFEENVAAGGLQLSPEQPDGSTTCPRPPATTTASTSAATQALTQGGLVAVTDAAQQNHDELSQGTSPPEGERSRAHRVLRQLRVSHGGSGGRFEGDAR